VVEISRENPFCWPKMQLYVNTWQWGGSPYSHIIWHLMMKEKEMSRRTRTFVYVSSNVYIRLHRPQNLQIHLNLNNLFTEYVITFALVIHSLQFMCHHFIYNFWHRKHMCTMLVPPCHIITGRMTTYMMWLFGSKIIILIRCFRAHLARHSWYSVQQISQQLDWTV
jgi:hypothetical protein